ncbi:MAG: LVIVD repeat-containing protein, partial [Candidatus Helarchaeota archaeon]
MRGVNFKGYLILSILIISISITPFFIGFVNNSASVNLTNENSDIQFETSYAWEEPNELGSYQEASDDCRGIDVVSNIAYIADDDLGLLKINVSDPRNPQKLGSFNNDFSAASHGEDVKIANGLAYVADGNDGMEIINVSTMQRVGNFIDGSAYAHGIDVVGNIAYLADGSDGLEIVNVSDPMNPTKLGNYTVGGSGAAYDVQIVGSVAFIAFQFEGLHIVNITDSINPYKIANFTEKNSNYLYPEGLVVIGDYVYCSFYSTGGLGIINITDLTNPTLISQVKSLNPGAFTYGITVENNVAFLATQFGIRTFNISDVKNPTMLNIYNISGGQTYDVAVVGNLIYTCSGQAGLHILEGYNSTSVAWAKVGLLSQYISPYSNIETVHVEGNIAFLGGTSHTLEIVNISDVHNPTYISHVNISEATFYSVYDIDVEGDLAYVAFRRGGVAIFNVSDLSNPVNTANITLTYNSSVAVYAQGELLYIVDQFSSRMFSIYNCSDPYNPIQVYSSAGVNNAQEIDM